MTTNTYNKFLPLWSGCAVTASKKELTAFLRETGASPIFWGGRVANVESKHLGVGVYKVWFVA